MAAGEQFDIVPYGTEALGLMRIEKGHPAGNELDGRITARDLGLDRMMSNKKDYVGRVLADRQALLERDRARLVGFRAVNTSDRLRAGAHIVTFAAAIDAAHDQGVMTSVAFSPSLGHWIGLGYLQCGPDRVGERVCAVDPVRNNNVEVEVCPPCFIDPKGERLRV